MKSKPVIIAGLVVLTVLLIVSIITVNQPQQAGTKAQSAISTQQCQNDGGVVTDQQSCTGPGKQIINFIVDGTIGGDGSNVQVCCRTVTPSPTPMECPLDAVELPENECLPDDLVSLDGSVVNSDNKYISPGIVCCKPRIPIPIPTATSCPQPTPPTINITNVEITCPDGCAEKP